VLITLCSFKQRHGKTHSRRSSHNFIVEYNEHERKIRISTRKDQQHAIDINVMILLANPVCA